MASDNPDEWWQHSPEGQQKNSPSGEWQNSPSGQWPQGHPAQGGQTSPGTAWGQQTGGPAPYQQLPQQGAWEVPPLGGPTGGGPPSKNSGPLIAVLGIVVALVLVGVVGLVVLQGRGSDTENAAAGSASQTSASVSPSTSAAETTTRTTDAPGDAAKPTLREGLSPVAVLGPTWADGEDMFTMAFADWPFAFRAPKSFNCLKGTLDKIPDAQAWTCMGGSGTGQKVNLILRECPNICDAATQKQFNDAWFDNPGQAKSFDDKTSYVETVANDTGKYTVDFSRFFAAEPGGEPTWQVGVYVESPAGTKDAVLKTLNDIATQTQ